MNWKNKIINWNYKKIRNRPYTCKAKVSWYKPNNPVHSKPFHQCYKMPCQSAAFLPQESVRKYWGLTYTANPQLRDTLPPFMIKTVTWMNHWG